jgi:hypothetical protein
MRTAVCNAIYWLIEPLLERLDKRQAMRDEQIRRASALKES